MAQVGVPPRLTRLLASWDADATAVSTAATDILARLAEPHRRYHTIEHVDEMLAVTDRLGAGEAVELAVWFHDAVYEPPNGDNEARSAAYARVVLGALGAPGSLADEVARLVLSTARHEPDDGDANACMLTDADLAILGAPPDRHARYRADVRAEYAHLDDATWRAGRAQVLRAFLERDRLFHDRDLRAELEGRARENLRAELVALAAS